MIKNISDNELNARIELNFKRLANSPYYQINDVFSEPEYSWPGDKEGRALLSFICHYKINGKKIPCMDSMLKKLPAMLNEKGYLGTTRTDVFVEQQLAGHSWMLRGLCEYYEQFGDKTVLDFIKNIVKNLYMRTKGCYGTYPIDRIFKKEGDVSGVSTKICKSWLLSSDVGCAFTSIDGLSHVYKVTKIQQLRELLDEMIDVYLSIDKVALCVQTHCTLTAARGMLRMYSVTDDEKYLNGAKAIYDLYVNGGGMTYTYQNLNWWGRPDTWTEPCAIIDSLMVATELYKITGNDGYRETAARIFHNGFATIQRDNGGAGTDTVVTDNSPWDYLGAKMYEAYFCCTMRLAEGLWYVKQNTAHLYVHTTGGVAKNEHGIYFDGDIIYAMPDKSLLPYAENIIEADGLKLAPIVKYYRVPKEIIENSCQKIIFK